VRVLNPAIKNTARRLLPARLAAVLDPVEAIIDGEVRYAADHLGPGQTVLDAGAGEARHRNFFTRGLYVAIDAGSGDPGWDYSKLDIRGDLENIPLRDGTVDRILCMVVLEHTRDPHRTLAEFGRVLKQGGALHMVVPFLWEEHQAPHDYFRFTRYGVRHLFDGLPFRVEVLSPMGGFFRVCARRCVNLLSFFQRGWRWPLFVLLSPFFGFLFPVVLHFLDGLDDSREFSLGFQIRATKDQA
jgi:SAM-dependent methyltransferase